MCVCHTIRSSKIFHGTFEQISFFWQIFFFDVAIFASFAPARNEITTNPFFDTSTIPPPHACEPHHDECNPSRYYQAHDASCHPWRGPPGRRASASCHGRVVLVVNDAFVDHGRPQGTLCVTNIFGGDTCGVSYCTCACLPFRLPNNETLACSHFFLSRYLSLSLSLL